LEDYVIVAATKGGRSEREEECVKGAKQRL